MSIDDAARADLDKEDASHRTQSVDVLPPDNETRLDVQRWLPGVVVAALATYSVLSTGVEVAELALFALYWTFCLLVPGTLVMRALLGPRRRPLEGLALGAITGLALEAIAFAVFDRMGAGVVVRWWWIAPYALFASIPALRRHWRGHRAARLAPATAWSLAAMSGLAVVIGWQFFRTTSLSPTASAPYVDHWFHLSVINEFMRPGPHVVPQVAGEALTYHGFSHAHIANASSISGLDPELVFSRLWVLPILMLTTILIHVLAGAVTGKQWGGPLACWLAFAALSGNYIWPDRSATLVSPLATLSPSQLFANPIMMAGAIGLVALARGASARRWLPWLLIIFIAAVGAKPTVIPALLGGTGLAIAAAWWFDRRAPRSLLMALGTLLTVQLVWTAINPPPPGNLTILGSVGSLVLYRELTGVGGLRANSSRLLLDSLVGTRAWFAAGASLVWLAAVQATRLIGIATVFRRSTRTDPVAWLMTGALVAGWGTFFLVDQSGFGQAYFVLTVVPVGAVLTVWLLTSLLDEAPSQIRRRGLALGLTAGAAITVIVRGLVSGRAASPSYGALESALLPIALVGAIGAASAAAWRRWGGEIRASAIGGALVVAAVIGMTLPPAVGATMQSIGQLSGPVASASDSDPGFVPSEEQDAMRWLRRNTPDGDVVATNVHCRPASSPPEFCDARSFMVSGLGGKRTVLEGWAYTTEAQLLHGVDGRGYQNQPTPFPVQYALSQAALHEPTAAVLETLAVEHDARWLVGIRRAGPVSPALDELAEKVFDNGDVVIYQLDR